MGTTGTEELRKLESELSEARKGLNTSLAMIDHHDLKTESLMDLWVLSARLLKIFETHGREPFVSAFRHVVTMLECILYEDHPVSEGFLAMIELLNPLDEALDCYLSMGEVVEDHLNAITFQMSAIHNACSPKPLVKKERTPVKATGAVTMPALPEDAAALKGKFDELRPEEAELLNDFLAHASEIISQTEDNFLILEGNPQDDGLINDIFRGIHTLKGDSGFLNLREIQTISHAFETLLGRCRSKSMEVTSERITFFLQTLEVIKRLMNNLAQRVKLLRKEIKTARITEIDVSGVLEGLHAMIQGKGPDEEGGTAVPAAKTIIDAAPVEAKGPESIVTDAVRVPQAKIESAEEMVGELMITLSLLKQSTPVRAIRNRDTVEKFDQLEMIIEQLQGNVLKMKMYPIGGIFSKLSRMVRDTSNSLHKKINFVARGTEVEIDKTVIDEIYSPLMHIIRNSIDHGIELPEARAGRGKPPSGTIELSAENVGDNVVIVVKDDGGGLNREGIIKKAVEKNLIGNGDELSDTEVYNLIFAPGFSTAEQVTDLSGRGVGMDVVRTTVEKLGGSIRIGSEPGKGTEMTIKLPLSSSIIDGLVCRVGASRYVFPMIKILYTLTPAPDAIQYAYEGSGLFIIFEGTATPVLKLGDFYGVKNFRENPDKAVTVIIEYRGKYYGIMVDEILQKQKVVAKSFKDRFQKICGLKSATILGDGSVGFIIEPDEIIREGYMR